MDPQIEQARNRAFVQVTGCPADSETDTCNQIQ
jgi:hypothetical protein